MYYHKRRKILFTGAALFCLSQCVVWTVIYISAITLYSCSTSLSTFMNFPEKQTDRLHHITTLTYVAYLWNGNCERKNFTKSPYWPKLIPSSERTYKWMFSYSILTSVWIPTCVTLIIAGFCSTRSRDTIVYLSTPWLIITFILCVMDLLAALIYATDISQMKSKSDYLHFIGIQLKDTSLIEGKIPPTWNYDTIIPPIIFTMLFMRLIVVWLLNVYFMISIANTLIKIKRLGKDGRETPTQNFEMNIINKIQGQRQIRTHDLPGKPNTYVPWMDVVTLTTSGVAQSEGRLRRTSLFLNTKFGDEYDQAKGRNKHKDDKSRMYISTDSFATFIGDSNSERMKRRHSEDTYAWREKFNDLNMRRFSDQQPKIMLKAETAEQRKKEFYNKVNVQMKGHETSNWYEPIWEMMSADNDSHYTTIENDLYSGVFDYLGQPTSRLQAYNFDLNTPSPIACQPCKQPFVFNYPSTSTNIRNNNPLKQIWNEIQILQYPVKTSVRPPPSPRVDYEL